MNQWKELTLGEVLKVKHGFAFKGEHFAQDGEHLLLTPGNFRAEGGLKFKGDKEKFYTGPVPQDYVLAKGDMVVAMTDLTQNAPLLGSTAFIEESGRLLHNQRLGKVTELRQEVTTPEFVYWLLNSTPVRVQIKATATGATVKHTAPERIYRVRVRFPPLETQQRITSVLDAYDDLIENCERRIKVLDEMARALYREWFVEFRYPGRARLGADELPPGWRRAPISSIYSALYDGPHATPAPSNEGPVFLGIGNITEEGTLALEDVRHIAEEEFAKWTKRVTPQAGDIVFTYEATLHRYALIPEGFRGCLGRRLALIRVPREAKANRFLFLTLLSPGWKAVVCKNITSGSTVDRIPLTTFPTFPITIPTPELIARFDDVVRPLMDEQQVLIRMKASLRTTRDLLLPRLLSGELAIKDVA